MSRLGMLYAISDDEVSELRLQKEENMYGYMLENIEEKYFSSPRAYELDKAWEGIQFCLCGGRWNEKNSPPQNIIFSGEFLLDYNDYVITLKSADIIEEIVVYLDQNNLQGIIKTHFKKIKEEDYTLPKDENNLAFLLDWSKGVAKFYKMAKKNSLNVIFTVDL